MNVRLSLLVIISIFSFISYGEAACTGNSLGQCTELDPTFCVIERLVIGSSLTETQDLDVGRTSFSRYPIPFVHDGATPDFLSSTFAVTAIPSSPSDAGSSINEVDCQGSVTVFFNTSERKTVRLRAFQDVFNRTATSSNAMVLTFDQLAPSIQPQQVFESEEPNNSPIAYSAGLTYYTSTDIFVTGRIVDPAPSVSSDQLSVQVVGGLAQSGQILASTGEMPGMFAIPLGIEQEQVDGEYFVELVAWDTANSDATFNDGSPANKSEAVVYKVVKDTSEPVMTRLEIVRNANTADQVVEEAPGVYIRRETVLVKAIFSEDLKTPPALTVIQKGSGVGTPPDPYLAIHDPFLFATSPSEVIYSLTPQAGTKDIGPIDFVFEGGLDRAGNAVSTSEGILANGNTIFRSLVLDTVPPDLNRIRPQTVGVIQSDPASEEILSRGEFPSEIVVIVKDYDLPDNLPDDSGGDPFGRENASGVDFGQVANLAAQEGVPSIYIQFLGPDGQELPGTLSTKPPNGLVYILPEEDELFANSSNRQAPEGRYSVTVGLVDKVGNFATETFAFIVDNTDVRPESIQVTLLPFENIQGFTLDQGNPLLAKPITGIEIPDSRLFFRDLEELDSFRELSSIEICSHDPTFNLTRSEVFLKARLNGPDTVPRTMNTTISIDTQGSNGTCESAGIITLVPGDQNGVFPVPEVEWPNPAAVGSEVFEGQRDPRFGMYDGPYLMEIIARDGAGNISDPIEKEFLLDTTPPFTRLIFPENFSKINTPLRHFSAVVEDPHPPKLHVWEEDGHLNFGSGISKEQTAMQARLQLPYRQEDLDTTLFDVVNQNMIKGRLSYVHRPNSFDSTLPSYRSEDDFYRVLLEFIDEFGNVRTLPQDGSADGIYAIEVTPVDNAGNSIDGALAGNSGWKPSQNPDLDGPQELRKKFFFLMDTVPPNMVIDSWNSSTDNSSLIVAGNKFSLSGKSKDLSARRDFPGRGGSGMKQVDWEVVLLKDDGSLALPEAQSSATSIKKNPVVTGIAIMRAIEDSSKDPTLDSSRPLDASVYANITLEERVWRLDGEIPPFVELIRPEDVIDGQNAKYFLRVYARDMAGNSSMQSIEMVLNQGDLFAPDLVAPVLKEFLGSTAVNFEWKVVSNAADYILYVSNPSGELTTYVITPSGGLNENVKTLQILNTNGLYEWWVKARDSLGNEGNQSLRQSFTIDTLAPHVDLVTWMDISPDTIPTITRGQFIVRITFDNGLKFAPQVNFQPFLSSIPKQLIQTYRLTENIWEGRAQIPQSADNSWDGQAILHIENATDFAGNTMIVDRTHAFEIETGPNFSVRFFENPVANEELTLVIRSTEVLSGDPVISMPRNLKLLQERPLKIGSKIYSTNLRLLENTLDGNAEITIVGQDLLGNTATRAVTFAVGTIDGSGGGLISNSKLKVELKPGSFEGRYNIALLPPSELELKGQVNNVSASLSKSTWSQTIGSIYPSALNLISPVSVAVKFDAPLAPKTGLFLSSAGGLKFLTDVSNSTVGEWRSIELDALGSLHIAQDFTAPNITIPYDLSQDLFLGRKFSMQLQVQDDLSGLDFNSINAELDKSKLIAKTDADGNVMLESRYYLPEGNSELRFEASDRMGNKIVHKAMLMIAGPLKMQLNSYPNPASQFATLEYRLSQAVKNVRLKIYDVSSRLVFTSNSNNNVDLPTHGGTHKFEWLLNSQQDLDVANGIYVAQLIVQDESGVSHKLRCKIAVIR